MPVKRLDAAKSRLRGSVTPVSELALAFALDTSAAVLASPQVALLLVVTADATVRREMEAIGAAVIDDPGGGLNAAIAEGVGRASDRTIVLTGDLPSLRTADLDEALRLAAARALAMVADHVGTGTTLLSALDPRRLRPRFGVDSRAAHEALGHEVLDVGVDSSVRRDVDTAEDLAGALRRGVGAATAAVAAGASAAVTTRAT